MSDVSFEVGDIVTDPDGVEWTIKGISAEHNLIIIGRMVECLESAPLDYFSDGSISTKYHKKAGG